MTRAIFAPTDLDNLIAVLAGRGFEVIGPTLDSGVVTLSPIDSTADLPEGIRDEQSPGRYHAKGTGDGELFGYAVGPTSLKPTLFPSRRQVWTTENTDNGIIFRSSVPEARPVAVIGARPCDAAAMAVQDEVLLGGAHIDTDYARRRRDLFLVVVNCTRPASTCFCASMGTGPAVTEGFDIALTELKLDTRHFFVAESGSESGQEVLGQLGLDPANPDDEELVRVALQHAADSMERTLDPLDAYSVLRAQPEHPHWKTIAERCLTCANCTMVCPTCFCVTTEPVTNLEDESAGAERRWDSCFSLDYSFMGGSPVRESVESRYRQWLTHKLSTWFDQFGTSGCVGCGRCITWCPVGIDLTEEVRHLREPIDA